MIKNLKIVLITFTLFAVVYFANNHVDATQKVIVESLYPADFSDPAILIGAAHNVFVGRVIEQSGTKERGIGPETQFFVEVIETIKGDLRGKVVVNQQGGIKDGKLFVMEGDVFTTNSQDPSLLEVGSTYLFTTRYNVKNDWHTLISYPQANKLISSVESDTDKLKDISISDARFQELLSSYPHEIVLEADVRTNNTLNSYETLVENTIVEVATITTATSTDLSLSTSTIQLQANFDFSTTTNFNFSTDTI